MRASFVKAKDISFDAQDGKHIDGKQLTTAEGVEYKLYGKAAKSAAVGPEYEFDADEKNKINGQTFREVGASAPQQTQEPDKRQSSIEAQNARTNLTNLACAGLLKESKEPMVNALISQLCSFAGIRFDGEVTKSGHLVEAAKGHGAETLDGLRKLGQG